MQRTVKLWAVIATKQPLPEGIKTEIMCFDHEEKKETLRVSALFWKKNDAEKALKLGHIASEAYDCKVVPVKVHFELP